MAITALVKPNALLLIGRAESIKSALELIGRLDLPGDPANQFKTFRLKHATAAVVSGNTGSFTAAASGNIDNDTSYDQWSISSIGRDSGTSSTTTTACQAGNNPAGEPCNDNNDV